MVFCPKKEHFSAFSKHLKKYSRRRFYALEKMQELPSQRALKKQVLAQGGTITRAHEEIIAY
jgi:hypothetical protein